MADHDTWQLHRFLRVEKIGSGLASSVYRVLDSKTNMQVRRQGATRAAAAVQRSRARRVHGATTRAGQL